MTSRESVIRIDRKAFIAAAALVLLSAAAVRLWSESLTLVTTYPSPSGIYNQIVTTGNSGSSPADTTLNRNAGNTILVPPTNSNGKVGIGTNIPAAGYELHVTAASDANVRIEGAATNSAVLNFRDANGANANAYFGTENSAGGNLMTGSLPYSVVLANAYARSLHLGTGNNVRLTVDSIGNVGIGLAAPADALAVNTNGYVVSLSGVQSPLGPSSGPRIKFGDVGNYNSYLEIGAYGSINNIDNKGRQLHVIGNMDITGSLSKGSGSFLIDHPLDPKNKVLRHSFVESPDMKNIYDGFGTLNKQGQAIIELPAYFEALNRDFRYQLTPVGKWAPLYIKQEIKNGKFIVASNDGPFGAGFGFNWQVTGVRRDAYAKKHPIVVEEEKGTGTSLFKKGDYLYPDAVETQKPDAK